MAAPVAPPSPVFIYSLSGDRYKRLAALWSYYEGRQHDHCSTDWHGRVNHTRKTHYLEARVREKGFGPQQNRSSHDDRRPNVPQGLIPRVVDRFTDMTCGKQASIPVRGDEDSTMALEALIEKSDGWEAIVEAETIAGACGSSAILPVLDDGEPGHEVFKPFELYVREWADKRRWIPSEVIHQIAVNVEHTDPVTKEVATKTMVRTRMWTETHAYTFEDVDKATWKPDAPLVLAAVDGEIEHGWGRCPIVWHQNIRDTSSPDGQYDARNQGNLELSDMADRVASHAVKATRANTEPTLVRGDRDIMFQLHPGVAKGVGNEIRTSEVGQVKLLETTGTSVTMAWDGVDRIALTLLRNVNCVVYDVDMAAAASGGGDSGEALAQRAQAMTKRCNRKRVPLRRTITQLLKMWLGKMRTAGISADDDPDESTVILPPRGYVVDADDETDDADEHEEYEARSRAAGATLTAIKQSPAAVLEWSDMERAPEKFGPHKLGEGTSLDFRWPPYQELTPMQIQSYLSALSGANGGKATLSQQTSVELVAQALGQTDAEAEKRRILEEKSEGLERIQAMVGGGEEDEEADGEEAEKTGAAAAEEGEEKPDAEPAPGAPAAPGGDTKVP